MSYFVNDKLLRKDFYSYTRYCSEYSAPKDNQAKVYQRRFYNEDGSTAYDMIVGDNNQISIVSLIRFSMVSKNSFVISSNVWP